MARAKFWVVGKMVYPKSWGIADDDSRTARRFRAMEHAAGKRGARGYSIGNARSYLVVTWNAATARDAKRIVTGLRRAGATASHGEYKRR